jgi:hypothetical protein
MGMAFPYAMGKATVSNQKMKEFPSIPETFAKKIPGIANQTKTTAKYQEALAKNPKTVYRNIPNKSN